jgi:hypothetical protein
MIHSLIGGALPSSKKKKTKAGQEIHNEEVPIALSALMQRQ